MNLRFALRALRLRPGFAGAAILSLSVGIAANTAIFSVANALLFARVPGVHRPDGVVHLTRDVNGEAVDLSHAVVRHLREERALVEQVGAYAAVRVSTALDDAEPGVASGLAAEGDYFGVLGVRPLRGRLFTAAESDFRNAAPVAVISEHLWDRAFGRREDLIGRTMRVNGVPVQLIGITGDNFAGHHSGVRFDIFLPLGVQIPGLPSLAALEDPESGSVEALARLRTGVAPNVAARELTASVARFRSGLTLSAPGRWDVGVPEWRPLPLAIRSGATAFLAVLFVLVTLALSMACMNVTTMLLARAAERRREIAIRLSLGATQGKLVRQLVTEALVLFVIAGSVGTVAAWLLSGMAAGFSPQVPLAARIGLDVPMDWRVLGFALLATFGTGVLFSLVPAMRAGRLSLVPALKDGDGSASPTRARWRTSLVGVQVAITTVLLVAAGLFVTSLRDPRSASPGFSAEDVQVLDLDVELRGATAAEGRVFYAALLERVRALPGVQHATLAAKLPIAGCSSFGRVSAPGAGGNEAGLDACFNRVAPDYFATLALPLREGRDISESDREGAPAVAVINQAMADGLFPSGAAIGRQFVAGRGDYQREFTVIGVAATATYPALQEAPAPFYYVPAQQAYNSQMVLHVRSAPGMLSSVGNDVRSAVRALDPHLPVGVPRPLTEALSLFFLPQRIASWVAGTMGVFALLLAMFGVYGVTAYVVAARRREVGIRMALGATRQDIVRLILRRQSFAPTIGLVTGLALGAGFGIAIHNVLRTVEPANPIALGVVPLVIGAVAVVAVVLPTWRMLLNEPMRGLRSGE